MVIPGDDHLLAGLEKALLNLGAEPAQASVMAGQLLKRARQIAAEREIPETEAMAGLLEKVVAARRGEYTGGDPAPPTQ